jgi:hypothetical protein
MDSLCANCKGNIDAVIDDERYLVLASDFMKTFANAYEVSSI